MKILKNRKLIKYIIIIIITLIVILAVISIPVLRQVIKLLFISFVIAYVLKPIYKIMLRKGINKNLSAIIILLVLVIFISSIFIVFIPCIFKESLNINNTIIELQTYIKVIYKKLEFVNSNKFINGAIETISEKLKSNVNGMFTNLFDSAIGLGGEILVYLASPVIVYYFLVDSENTTNKILIAFPAKSRGLIKKIMIDIDKILGRYILSQFILCGMIGIATFLVLVMLHVEFPIMLSVINAAFNIIPYFGPLFGAIPAIFIAFLVSPKTALWTLVWLYVIQQIEGDIISPKIIGESISMHPVSVILLLIVGGQLGGMLGMVLAVPMGVVFKVIYEDLNYYLF